MKIHEKKCLPQLLIAQQLLKKGLNRAWLQNHLQKTDHLHAGNLGRMYDKWKHGMSFPRNILPTPLECWRELLLLLRKFFWPVAPLLIKENYSAFTVVTQPDLWLVVPCSEWQKLLNRYSHLLVPEAAFFACFLPAWLEQIMFQQPFWTSKNTNQPVNLP